MWKLRIFRALKNAARVLSRLGMSNLSPIRSATTFIKQKWYREFSDPSVKSLEISLHGLRLCIPQQFVPHYAFQEYEPVTRKAFSIALRPGMVVVDIGAHIGYYTLLAAKAVGNSGRVYAIEPDEGNMAYLKKNVTLNRFENVRMINCAAGRERRQRLFHITGSSDSYGFYPHPLTETLRTIEVSEIPADDIVKGAVHIVKIDVEGAEIEVLDGMKRVLRENEGLLLCVEWSPACMRNAGLDALALPSYLQDLGFRQIQVLDDGAKRIRPLDEVRELVRRTRIPDNWYVNLWARRV